MSNVQIRRAEAGDLAAIQDIARRTIDGCYGPFLGDQAVDWFIDSGESDRELQQHVGNCDVLLRENAIVALAVHFDDLIHLLMVDVRLHRSGLGSHLLAHVENQLFARGNTTIRLETFAGNHQAVAFYTKNGWSMTGMQADEEHGFTRVLFEKKA